MRGLPISWEPIISAPEPHAFVVAAAWSPCSRFIAVARLNPIAVEVLDSTTLERLHAFDPPFPAQWLSFSPKSRFLSQFGSDRELASWDLQTGGPIGTTTSEPYTSPTHCFSSTYSMDGKMVAIAYGDADATITAISTYDLPSGTHTYSYRASEGHIVAPIWTHGECLRFVTVKPGSIVVWEVGFTSIHTLAEVESLPAPDDIHRSEEHLFLPTLSRLAFTLGDEVLVWDARDSRILLSFLCGDQSTRMSFSPDGRFFACGTVGLGVHLWKESPTGYVLHHKLIPGIPGVIRPLLSPCGDSIVMLNHSAIQVWHTSDPTPSLSDVPTQIVEPASFILEFSPDETLAAVVRLEENMATVLDLGSGSPRLIVDTGMKILGLRMTGSTIVVVGGGKVVTWSIPAEDWAFNIKANIIDSILTTIFDYSPPVFTILVPSTSISPDFNRIAVAGCTVEDSEGLNVYDVSTGKCVAETEIQGYMRAPWFTPDGCEVWCMGDFSTRGWTIVEESESDLTRLEPVELTAHPSGGFPWESSHGYTIMDDGWVLDSSGKRLLWLPHHWRSDETDRTWSGRFLGLLRCELPEAVILELDE